MDAFIISSSAFLDYFYTCTSQALRSNKTNMGYIICISISVQVYLGCDGAYGMNAV